MSFVELDVRGLAEMRSAFTRLANLSTEQLGLARAVTVAAEAVMRDSRRLVPVVTGNLRASGTVEAPVSLPDEVSIGMGYGGAAKAYALKVHENPRAGKTGGVSPNGKKYPARRWSQVGQWKFLEQPFLAARERSLAIIFEAVQRAIGSQV